MIEFIISFFFQPKDEGFHSQEQVYHDLGEEMLEHSFEGRKLKKKIVYLNLTYRQCFNY